MKATEFRQHLYTVLGRLADEGGTVTITHKNRTFRVIPDENRGFLERLVPHDTLNVPPDDLVAAESSGWEWREPENFDGIS